MRRLSKRVPSLFVLAFVVLLGGQVVAEAQTARVGREFDIRVGRVVTLDGGRLRVRFTRVASDSRCPVDVDCIWAGNAEVLIEVGERGWKGKRTLTLNTSGITDKPREARYGRYTLKLVGLAPPPRSTRKIAAGRYTATLLVSKE